MHAIRIGFALMLTIWLAGAIGSCTLTGSLGYSGPKRYKTEMLASFSMVQKDIEKNGQVSDASFKKAKDVMAKWQEEMSKQGSYMCGEKIVNLVEEGKSDPNKAYRSNQNALVEINRLQETLKTEVAD